ncbi:MAG: hypothetical protein M3Y31_01960 [Gemmatimonadota bacterium]|nr:hypothetical protein [Gemmatimonadota bacterium]
MITELEGLFRQLVREIVAREPERIHRPMTVGEVTDTWLPYRLARRTLDLHAADEYETLLVRLFAGEGGMVHLQDRAARDRFAAQAASTLPDLDILRRESDARFDFWTEALAYALGPGDRSYAPPEERATLGAAPAAAAAAPTATEEPPGELLDEEMTFDEPFGIIEHDPAAADDPRCGYCGGMLPGGRAVNFCPHCGQSQTGARCPECRNDVEEGWRHCITCGFPLTPA